MNCTQLKKILHQKRVDELTAEELLRINNHTETCHECSLVFKAGEIYNRVLNNISAVTPINEREDELTDLIIQQIESKATSANSLKQRILSLVETPLVRFAMAAVLILIFGFYFHEEYTSLHKISIQENRFKILSDVPANNYLSGYVDAGLINSFKDIYNLIEGRKAYVNLSGGWFMLKESEIRNLLILYSTVSQSQETDDVELKKIFETYLNNAGIDLPELLKVLETKQAISKKFKPPFKGENKK